MSGKRHHHEREINREVSTQRVRLDALARGVAVDPTALTPHNSYSPPDFVDRGYYVDKPFVCQVCGISQTWTADNRSGGMRSRREMCSRRPRDAAPAGNERGEQREEARLRGGDPNPYKNPGLLLGKVRSEIEPELLSVGYRPSGGTGVMRGVLYSSITAARTTCSPSRGISTRRG